MAVLKATVGTWVGPTARRLGAACLFGLAMLGARAAPAEPISAEYKVKAVFLFRFTQFVEWPAQAFNGPKAPLVIGVLGEDPFGSYLDDLAKGEKVDDHPVIVRRFRNLSEIGACNLLFISRSEAAQLTGIIARLQGMNVLTLGDSDDFSRQGGMVRFAMERGKIRPWIDVKATTAAGLTISSKVLLLAKIVTADR